MTKKEKTIEQRVADTILERPLGEVVVDGETYKIASPTIGTLILASEIISTMPTLADDIKRADVVYASLHYAKDFRRICDLLAVLILGAKGLKLEVTKSYEKRIKRLWGLLPDKTVTVEYKEEVNNAEVLAEKIFNHLSTSEVWEVMISVLQSLNVGTFFSITTSLNEVNILKPSREVGQKATVSGQQ